MHFSYLAPQPPSYYKHVLVQIPHILKCNFVQISLIYFHHLNAKGTLNHVVCLGQYTFCCGILSCESVCKHGTSCRFKRSLLGLRKSLTSTYRLLKETKKSTEYECF